MRLLTIADGLVKLNNSVIDAILTGLNVSGEVTFDDQKRDALSGTKKVPMGWTDADITVMLDLITDDAGTCYDRLKKLNATFKSLTDKKAPQVFDVANPHLAARGVRKVVFAKFDSSETNQDDVIAAILSFIEHDTGITKEEEADLNSGTGAGTQATEEPKPEASITVDVATPT